MSRCKLGFSFLGELLWLPARAAAYFLKAQKKTPTARRLPRSGEKREEEFDVIVSSNI
jgi:hypothetical protein